MKQTVITTLVCASLALSPVPAFAQSSEQACHRQGGIIVNGRCENVSRKEERFIANWVLTALIIAALAGAAGGGGQADAPPQQ